MKEDNLPLLELSALLKLKALSEVRTSFHTLARAARMKNGQSFVTLCATVKKPYPPNG